MDNTNMRPPNLPQVFLNLRQILLIGQQLSILRETIIIYMRQRPAWIIERFPKRTTLFSLLILFGIINLFLFQAYLLYLAITPLKCFLDENCKGFPHEVTYGDFLISIPGVSFMAILTRVTERGPNYTFITDNARLAGDYMKEKTSEVVGTMTEKVHKIIATSDMREDKKGVLDDYEEPLPPLEKTPKKKMGILEAVSMTIFRHRPKNTPKQVYTMTYPAMKTVEVHKKVVPEEKINKEKDPDSEDDEDDWEEYYTNTNDDDESYTKILDKFHTRWKKRR